MVSYSPLWFLDPFELVFTFIYTYLSNGTLPPDFTNLLLQKQFFTVSSVEVSGGLAGNVFKHAGSAIMVHLGRSNV